MKQGDIQKTKQEEHRGKEEVHRKVTEDGNGVN